MLKPADSNAILQLNSPLSQRIFHWKPQDRMRSGERTLQPKRRSTAALQSTSCKIWRDYFFNERTYATSALMSASESLLPNGFIVSLPLVFTPSLIARAASASLNAAWTLASR